VSDARCKIAIQEKSVLCRYRKVVDNFLRRCHMNNQSSLSTRQLASSGSNGRLTYLCIALLHRRDVQALCESQETTHSTQRTEKVFRMPRGVQRSTCIVTKTSANTSHRDGSRLSTTNCSTAKHGTPSMIENKRVHVWMSTFSL
jgi:hypothetical protein